MSFLFIGGVGSWFCLETWGQFPKSIWVLFIKKKEIFTPAFMFYGPRVYVYMTRAGLLGSTACVWYLETNLFFSHPKSEKSLEPSLLEAMSNLSKFRPQSPMVVKIFLCVYYMF